jgi:hypothetical protein
MSKTVHSVKLQAYASVDLDRISYSGGDVVYDKTNGTLRVMDGETPGGGKLATQLWVQNSAGTITANLKGDIYTASGVRVLDNGTDQTNPAFFGDVYASNGTSKILDNGTDGTNALFTGSVTGNVTGNLTGNVTGNVTGNIGTFTTHNGTTFSASGNVTGGNLSVTTGTITVGNIVYKKPLDTTDTNYQINRFICFLDNFRFILEWYNQSKIDERDGIDPIVSKYKFFDSVCKYFVRIMFLYIQ